MSVELNCLAWAAILGLIHIFAAGQARTKELGMKWNMSARDGEPAKPGIITGRLSRAQSNFFETFPLFAASVLIVAVTQTYSSYSCWGALLYLVARVVYIPLYVFGIAVIRTLVWLISVVGLMLVLVPVLF